MHKEESHWESPEAAQVKELEEEIEKFRQEKEDLEKEKELEKQKEELEKEIEDLKEHMPKIEKEDDHDGRDHPEVGYTTMPLQPTYIP